MDSDERREDEEDQSLDGRECGPAEYFAHHDHAAADRRGQYGKQKTILAVFNHRHHGEDAGEEHDHDERAGIKICEVMLVATGAAERCAEARSNHQPEDHGRSDDAYHATTLAVE